MGKGTGGGLYNREGELTMLPDDRLKLYAEFFRQLVRRIETINPVTDSDADEKVIVVEDNKANTKGRLIKFNGRVVELDICENGAPAKLRVYAPKIESAT